MEGDRSFQLSSSFLFDVVLVASGCKKMVARAVPKLISAGAHLFLMTPIQTALAAVSIFAASSVCQSVPPDSPPADTNGKRVLGIIPNFRTSATLDHYKPLTPKEKFGIAAQDSFDRGTVVLAALFAGEGQLAQSEKSFGNGAAAYG